MSNFCAGGGGREGWAGETQGGCGR
eukprot:COSAG04_NODE_4012_length_2362_cov_10.515687_1_plen_24_part_10